MTRAILATGIVGALSVSGSVHASADYPPSAPVIVITGDIVTGGAVEVTVQNCAVGETLVTTLGSMDAIESECRSGPTGFARTNAISRRRPGLSQYQLALPLDPGMVRGQVELIDSDQTLSFTLDVSAPRPLPERVIVAASNDIPGWPFLLLAGLMIIGVLLLGLRRQRENEIP